MSETTTTPPPGQTPPPVQPAPQPQQQAIAQPQQQEPPRSTADTAAQLRAEAAAERVAKREAKEEAERLRGELARVQTEATAKIEAEVAPIKAREVKLQQRVMDAEIRAVAAAAGLVDMDLLPLIDRANVKIGEDGEVTGAAEAIAAFREKKPTYFQKAPAATTTTTTTQAAPRATGAPAPAPSEPAPKKATEMTPEEYKAANAKIMSGLRLAAAR